MEEEDEKPRKGIALKAACKDEKPEEDEEVALNGDSIMFIKKDGKRTEQGDRERRNDKENERRSFNCEKIGHIAAKCMRSEVAE